MGIPANPPVTIADNAISMEAEEEEIDLTFDFEEEEIVLEAGGDDFVNGFNAH